MGVDVFPPETIPGPDQLNVAPPVDELALIVPLVVVHVNARGGPAVTFGGLVFDETETVAVFVQPVTGLVTVTV